MHIALARAFGLAVAFSGCGPDPPAAPAPSECPPDAGFIGTPKLAPELEIGSMSPDGTFTPIDQEGVSIPVFTPPQGGKILLIGTRIANMDACATVVGRLRDPTAEGEPVAAREGREILFKPISDRPGWGAPRRTGTTMEAIIDEGPNVPACFNHAPRDLDGCEWILVVSVDDRGGRHVERRVRVTPFCPEDDLGCPGPGCDESDEDAYARCECECQVGFQAGRCKDLEPWREATDPACFAE